MKTGEKTLSRAIRAIALKSGEIWRLALLFLVATPIFSIAPRGAGKTMNLRIEDSSELYLNGSSNVNSFTCVCLCYEKNRRRSFQMNVRQEGRAVDFQRTVLQLRTHEMDCGNRNINKDLWQTLKVDDYPHITIEVLRASWSSDGSLRDYHGWMSINPEVAITIAGVRRIMTMNIRGMRLSDESYRFAGTHHLNMSDFQLNPPRPMLGLIKVHDRITISMDLIVSVSNA